MRSLLSLESSLSTRIKDARKAIRHSRGGISFYTAGSRNGLKGWTSGDTETKRKLIQRKRHFFVMENILRTSDRMTKHVPHLLESIMRPTDPVKEELRSSLLEISQFGSKITKIMVLTFWILEIRSFPAGGQCQPSHQ